MRFVWFGISNLDALCSSCFVLQKSPGQNMCISEGLEAQGPELPRDLGWQNLDKTREIWLVSGSYRVIHNQPGWFPPCPGCLLYP